MSHARKEASPALLFFSIYFAITVVVGVAVLVLWTERRAVERESVPLVDAVKPMLPGAEPNRSGEGKSRTSGEVAMVERQQRERPGKGGQPRNKEGKEQEAASGNENVRLRKEADDDDILDDDGLDLERRLAARHPIPDFPPLLEVVSEWMDVPESIYPKLVMVKVAVPFEVREAGRVVGRATLPPGSHMVPVRLVGDQLTVSSSSSLPVETTIPVNETDFKERIEASYRRRVAERKAAVEAARAATREAWLAERAAEDAAKAWNDGGDPLFDPMRKSLQRGDAVGFALEDARQWRWSGEEEIAGQSYETGLVRIVRETAFGEEELELKAVMENRRVVRWFDLRTGQAL